MNRTLTRGGTLIALVGALAFATVSSAQPDDIRQTVLRVAYFSGEVSYSRGDDPDDWQPASLNFPMTLGDRLYTGRGSRLELQAEEGAIYLAPDTDFAALNLTQDVKQFSLGIGSASFRIGRIDSDAAFEVDTPNAAVTFDRPGEFRIDVDRDGNTRVLVNRGHAYVSAGGGEVPLEAGNMMAIDGIDSPRYDVMRLSRMDSWDQWVASRARRSRDTGSRRYVHASISGVGDLDEYGRWSDVSGYGNCWSPSNVSSDWQPYRSGRWAWQDPWGWSWVSNEPWGWAPYHYGRWVNQRSRWYWVPDGREARSVRYSPALVVFIGGSGGANIGWFPLAPRDPFVPWWGSGARAGSVTAGFTNVTYVNRSFVTVVNQNTFISGAPVGTNVIRDARTVREISAAPVVRGPIGIVPIAASIRVSTASAGSMVRPPAAIQTRAVVTRMAPPPAPVPFREKESVIRENRGAPVAPAQAARLAPEAKAIRPTRPVVAEGNRVTLAPKNEKATTTAPVPVMRGVPPGQARRELPQAGGGQPAVDARAQQRQQQQDLDARAQQQQQLQQQQEGARKLQQQDIEARKQQQQSLDARKQQQDVDARAQQQQQLQQQQEGARRQQQQDIEARKQQQQSLDARKQQQDVDARAQQQQQQQQAEGARKQQQQQLQQQQAEGARKQQQQQAEDARRQRQDIEARTQHPAVEARKQPPPQAEAPRKPQPEVRDQKPAEKQKAAEDQKKEKGKGKDKDKAPSAEEEKQ